MVDTYTPTKHSSVVGGSTATRVLACPGSVRLLQSLDLPDTESPYAAEGTALHNAVEHCLYEGLPSDEDSLMDELLGKEFYGHKLTAGQVRTVADALRVFDALYAELEIDDGEVLTYAVETQSQFPGIPDAFGTADILMVTPSRSVVLDWKFGAGVPVSAESNKQLMFYAAAAAHSAPTYFWPGGAQDPGMAAGRRVVELIVVQPRVGDGQPSRWQTTFDAIEAFAEDLREAVATIDDKNVRFQRGDHCRWCGAAPKCPIHERTAQAVADLFNGVTKPGDRAEKAATALARREPVTTTARTFTKAELGDLLAKAEIAETWAASVRSLAHIMAEHGVVADGYKLVKAYGNLSWVQTDEAKIDKQLANKGLRVAERQKRAPITPTQANAILRKKGKPPLSEKIATRPVRGTKLVPLSAPGEPISAPMAARRIDVDAAFG